MSTPHKRMEPKSAMKSRPGHTVDKSDEKRYSIDDRLSFGFTPEKKDSIVEPCESDTSKEKVEDRLIDYMKVYNQKKENLREKLCQQEVEEVMPSPIINIKSKKMRRKGGEEEHLSVE